MIAGCTLPLFKPTCLPPDHHGRPPIGGEWIHEIKHDGYRMMVRRDVHPVADAQRQGLDRAPSQPS